MTLLKTQKLIGNILINEFVLNPLIITNEINRPLRYSFRSNAPYIKVSIIIRFQHLFKLKDMGNIVQDLFYNKKKK